MRSIPLHDPSGCRARKIRSNVTCPSQSCNAQAASMRRLHGLAVTGRRKRRLLNPSNSRDRVMDGSDEGICNTIVTCSSPDCDLRVISFRTEVKDIMCPACRSEAFYRYGRTRQGKQRFRCLLCGRQFTTDRKRIEVRDRPSCPVCGCGMHAYKREHDGIRFRCSAYPRCRTFLKVQDEERE